MKLSRTPLALALLASFGVAHAADATTEATDLSAIRVQAAVGHDTPAPGTGLDSYGAASLHDTPASVTVVDRKAIDERQIRTLNELAREDASLGDSYAPVGYYQDIAVRGYPLDLGTGMRMNNLTIAGEQPVALEDKQQVQVLKGLAGMEAGVMEPGGVLNYVSKRPDDVRRATLGTDSHGSRYGALDVGGWLTPTFGVRINAAYEDTHSYVQHADGRRNFYSAAVDWKLSSKATLQLDGNYQTSAQRSVSGYQLLGGSTIPAHASTTRMLGFQPWAAPVGIHAANASARFTYAFTDDWRLRLAAGHSRSVIDDNVAFAYGCYYADDCASGATPGNFFAPNGDYDVYDYRSPDDTRVGDEARAVLEGKFDTGALEHAVSLGASAFQRTIDRRQDVYDYVGTANIRDVDPPVFAPSPNQPGASARRLDSWQHALFALDRIQLGEHWQVIAGDRFVRLDERAHDSDGVPERHTRLRKALPQAAVLWQPSAPLTTYLSYSEGLSLGLEAPFWTSNDGSTLGARLSRQVEAGVKYRVGETLDLTGAVYRIRQPYQFALPDDTEAGFTFVQRGQEVHTGLELAANGQLSDNLGISASAGFIRARAEGTGSAMYEGHQVVNVPRVRATAHLDYRLPFAPALTVQGGWRYAGANVATPDGRERVPAYHVFDAGLRYAASWRSHPLVVQVGVDNLFNRFYWRDTGTSGGDAYLFPGAPRLARLSVTAGF